MTPFGEVLRRLRKERGVSQKAMAEQIGVSAAYLSALEHGRRAAPSFAFRQRVIAWANVIWDEADAVERAAALSDPKVTVDTSEASARATYLANRLAEDIATLDEKRIEALIALLDQTKA